MFSGDDHIKCYTFFINLERWLNIFVVEVNVTVSFLYTVT